MLNKEERLIVLERADDSLSELNQALKKGKPYRGKARAFVQDLLPVLFIKQFTWLPRATYLGKDHVQRSL